MDGDGQDPNAFAPGLGEEQPAAEIGGALGGEGDDENVDQYFDDGGETFLPADHVSEIKQSTLCNCLLTPKFYSLAFDGSPAKRFDETADR